MDDLVTFLRACLDEDERVAREADGDVVIDWIAGETRDNGEPTAGAHIKRWRPSRVLAEVGAKRKILDSHRRVDEGPDWEAGWGAEPACHGCGADFQEQWAVPDANGCPVVRLLALPYADSPGYRSEWGP